MDERAEQLSDLVLDYSVEIQENDRLLIQFDPEYTGYATLVARKAREKGAEVRYDPTTFNPQVLRGFLERYDLQEWEEERARKIDLSSWCNARVLIDCESNPNYAEGIEDHERKISEFKRIVDGPYRKVLYRPGKNSMYEVKWNIVGFPNETSAQIAGMTLEEYENFVYSATLIPNWEQMGREMFQVKEVFDGAADVHIIVPGLTDLHLSLEGRGGEVCDGKFNMPDGEVCYGPVENSLNGEVYFQIPTKREGFGVLEGIHLQFKDGLVTEYSARTNQKALEETLKTDEGSNKVGELGIGFNRGIKRAILETLFDEKIGGTIHLALGESLGQGLDEGGGLNESNIHWDIVCDLRRDESDLAEFPGGEIYVDGTLVQKNGVWQF